MQPRWTKEIFISGQQSKDSGCGTQYILWGIKLPDKREPFYVLRMKILRRRKLVFCKGALFRGKGGPPVLEQPAQHLPRQGRGFVRPPICPTPPAISSSYGG